MYNYKRNGFTLVELMAVITIISLISLLTFPNIINQIKKTKKSNNKMIEGVIIEQAKKYVNDNKEKLLEDEYCLSISTLIDNDYIKEDIVNINNIKDNKVVHITLDNNNSYEVLDKNKCFLSAVKYLLKKTNPITVTDYTDGDIHEMYTFEHEATVQTPALTDYRYIGSDPNNYVEFNNELWRIIGVFKVEDENGNWKERIKIVRNENIGKMAWDDSLIPYLNNDYYETIDSNSRKLINNAKYYLGGVKIHYGALDMYNYEHKGSASLSNIALIYPSDYLFTYSLGVDNDCYTDGYSCGSSVGKDNSWLKIHIQTYRWTYANAGTLKISIYGNGRVYNNAKTALYAIFPTLYLSSNVKITSGDGTKDNAYKLLI